ncbi:PLP-dependent aminotransferase family protein [Ectothiorhodospiraceae bacterium WFHF3C12]|nr:PLP-dependent aminotransferase family protein [Ectothiorhodospiraceae bacterium WFHF3C12]
MAALAEDGRPNYLYERICQRLEGQISGGTYAPGEQLPSLRRMSRLFGVSVTTVMQCYRKLEADGYVEARPQSGFFVRSREPAAVPAAPSGPDLLPTEVGLSERVLERMALHREPSLLRLGIALPAIDVQPVQRIMRTLADVSRHRSMDAWDYMHPHGHEALRHLLARRSLTHEAPLSPEEVFVTSGCMEAMSIAVRCISRPGDAIAVESPAYYGTLLMLEAHKRRVVEIPASQHDGICLDTLERAFARGTVAGCLFSANAQNPLGFTMSDTAKRRIVALSARYGIPLIENDIWGDTVYDPGLATPAKAYDSAGLVIYCNSFSKTLVPGFRVGWALPGRFLRRFQEIKLLTSITSPSPQQIALARLLESGAYEQHLIELRGCLERQARETGEAILDAFPEGTAVEMPSGGCVLWVRLPAGVGAERLFEAAVEAGVHIFPGTVFSSGGEFDDCIRVNVGNPCSAAVRAGVGKLGRLAGELAA